MIDYVPPYEITNEMINLVSQIMEKIGNLASVKDLKKLPRLRKGNRIKSIHSSLAIENNTLSYQEVTAVLDGKKVIAPPNDIIAVQNAFSCYEKLESIDPYSVDCLLNIHNIMMSGLVNQCGKIRTTNVGVFDNDGNIVHSAPPAELVPEFLTQLFNWLKTSDTHILIKSSIFHYEFEFLHPFQDGNGRMGRLWQTALLGKFNPLFYWLPIENLINENQEEYYEALAQSTSNGKSNVFIIFMLNIIKNSLDNLHTDTENFSNHINKEISALLKVMRNYPQSAQELMNKLGLKSRVGFRNNYLNPALEAGLIKMTIPEKPTSKNQMYYLC